MDTIKTFLEMLINSPHYSFGWIVAAILAILPAIVSVNLIQHDLSRLIRGANAGSDIIKTLCKNILILLVSISVIAYAYYLYFWE